MYSYIYILEILVEMLESQRCKACMQTRFKTSLQLHNINQILLRDGANKNVDHFLESIHKCASVTNIMQSRAFKVALSFVDRDFTVENILIARESHTI